MLYFILILLLMNVFSTIEASHKPTSLKTQRKKPYAAVVFSSTNNVTPSDKESCQWLKRLKHQSKICWKRRGLAEVLLHARNLSVSSCQHQFEFDRWNCSKTDFFFQNIYKETAFMHSIASSAIMFSVARACSEGTLGGCHCGDPIKQSPSKWQWGGCSDNTKLAKKFTKKFLQLKKKGDSFNAIHRYNAEIGIKVVLENEETICRCHGLSGTCTFPVCWKKIRPFDVIAKQLKVLYYNAIQVQPENKIRSSKVGKSEERLLFLENSPNLCRITVGRQCSHAENCDTLCCGRGAYPATVRVVNNTCDCRWQAEKFDVDCETCVEEKEILKCK